MKWIACLAIVAGCGGSAQRPRPTVHVRLARANEFPAQFDSKRWFWDDCKLEGAKDRQLYSAAIAYAVRELVQPVTRRGFEPQGTDVRFEGDRGKPHKNGVFTVIEIDPGSKVGALSVGQFEWVNGRSVWGTADRYCVHVLEENGATTLVLHLLWSSIG